MAMALAMVSDSVEANPMSSSLYLAQYPDSVEANPMSSFLAQDPRHYVVASTIHRPLHRKRLKWIASSHSQKDRYSKSDGPAANPLVLGAVAAASGPSLWARPALAVSAEEVAVVLTKVQDVYLLIVGVVRAAGEMFGMLLNQIAQLVGVGMSSVSPFIRNIISMAAQLSTNIVLGVTVPTEFFLLSIGINTTPAVEAFKTIVLTIKEASKQITKALEPVVSSILQSMLAIDSLFLLRTAGAVVLFYFLTPPVISSIACAARGYKGDLSASQALDLIMKRDYLLVDVRTEKEKSKSGVPNLPRYAINSLLYVPVEELSLKFKGRLRDYRKAEAEVAAIKISYLRRINKSSKLVILDRYGDMAKSVARSLTRLGLKNSWVVTDGFDGGRGWVQSRLGTASHSASIAAILSPTRIISEGAKKIFPSSKDIDVAPQPRKLLPGGFDE